MSLGGILEEHQAVSLGDRGKSHHVGRMSVKVNRHDRLGARSDRRLDRGRIECEVVEFDVGEDRGCARQADRVRGRSEAERRHDDLVAGADADGEEGKVQRGRARVDGDAVASVDERENSVSKAATSGPWASMPDARTRSTAARSSAPMSGLAAGIMSSPLSLTVFVPSFCAAWR